MKPSLPFFFDQVRRAAQPPPQRLPPLKRTQQRTVNCILGQIINFEPAYGLSCLSATSRISEPNSRQGLSSHRERLFRTGARIVFFLIVALYFQRCWATQLTGTITGQIYDIRFITIPPMCITNILSVSGVLDNGRFIVDVDPVMTKDEIAESVAWDDALYLIQRYPEEPGKGLPRDRSLGYIEPTIFSRYATPPSQALLMALADAHAAAALTNPATPVVLSDIRTYPEEESRYTLNYSAFGHWSAEAICPGFAVQKDSTRTPLADVYKDGFLRWRFRSEVASRSANAMVIHLIYERFLPKHQQQRPVHRDDTIKTALVVGELRLDSAPIPPTQFRPPIKEASLTVLDFRGRKDFVQATGNYNRDYCIEHVLTNRLWDIDERDAIKRIGTTQLAVQILAKKHEKQAVVRRIFYGAVVAGFAFLLVALWRNAKKQQMSALSKKDEL